jgi:hypothetical protein
MQEFVINLCWACDAPIDPSKSVKPFEEEEVFVEEGVKEEEKGKSNIKLQKQCIGIHYIERHSAFLLGAI